MPAIINGNTGVDRVAPNSIDQEDLKWVPPFTKEYTSAEQTVTAGSITSLAHGLGVMPKLVQVTLICKTAELGFSVGDEVDAYKDANTNNFNYSVGRNSTTLRCICGANGVALFSNTGAFTTVTPANWRLIVRAWA